MTESLKERETEVDRWKDGETRWIKQATGLHEEKKKKNKNKNKKKKKKKKKKNKNKNKNKNKKKKKKKNKKKKNKKKKKKKKKKLFSGDPLCAGVHCLKDMCGFSLP